MAEEGSANGSAEGGNALGGPNRPTAHRPTGSSRWAIALGGGGALIGLLSTILNVANDQRRQRYQAEIDGKFKTVQSQIDTQRMVIDAEIRRSQTDVEVLVKFRELYVDRQSRRLTRYFVRKIDDQILRSDLRQFVVWDIMERLARSKHGFSYDPDSDDWHILGETVFDLMHDSPRSIYGMPVESWWSQVKTITADTRWKDRKVDLAQMFVWLERNYFGPKNIPSMQNGASLVPPGGRLADSAR
jgi:hypothetical protein